jgi:AsmA protein
MMGFRVEPKLVMTTEGQGRTSDPVGFGIPVMIEGPWSGPRIYPDMQGVLDNPDAAYAKLREMGKGLFGANGGGLGGLISGLSGLTGNPPANNRPANNQNDGANGGNAANNDPLGGALGGNLGQALGSLLQKGLGNQSRSIPAPGTTQAAPPSQAQPQTQGQVPAPPDPSPQARSDAGPQDSQPMNDVLRQLFNR